MLRRRVLIDCGRCLDQQITTTITKMEKMEKMCQRELQTFEVTDIDLVNNRITSI